MNKTAAETGDHSVFFESVSSAKHRVLVVDYDGTIAPFTADRHRAVPYPKVQEHLQSIITSCGTRLIIVSGRPAREVGPLLGLHPAPEIWGSNGIERIDADGRYQEIYVNDDALQVLAQAETQLEAEGLGAHIEVKLAGVALHWRSLPAAEVLDIRTKGCRILETLTTQSDLVMSEFEEGIEIHLSSANKGAAVGSLLSEIDADVPIAYIGDDATDEQAFRALTGRGLTVLVAARHRFTAAQMRLKPPDEIIQFLKQWIRACSVLQLRVARH